MGKYEYVLKRLAEFRKSLDLTQVEMAEKLNISQEQYSYLENGKVKITAEMLRSFSKMGLSVNYLITGREERGDKSRFAGMFETVRDEEYKKKMKRLMVYLLNLIFISGAPERVNEKDGGQDLLRYLEKCGDDFSMILYVRTKFHLSQIAMADELGVGIKKYRKLEKELIYPDAELLFVLWQKSGCPPILFLDICDRELYIIDLFWNMLSEEQTAKAGTLFRDVEQFCGNPLL
ncbi:MAG: helix-turn-helix transcriptional regulator [Alistipes sp.]|nr:helix-turn-helix transcriptional regulator [Alistipes sp.]